MKTKLKVESYKLKVGFSGVCNFVFAVVFSSLPLLPSNLFAAQLGGQAGAFSRMGLGADRVAMGDCGVAMTGAGMNWYYNPAGLAYQRDRQVSLGYRWMSLDRKMMYIGFTTPLKGNAAVGFGYVRAATDNIDARDSNGEHFDMLSNSDNLLHATFALMPHKRVSLGVSLKWFIGSVPTILDDNKTLYGYGMGVDLGVRIVAADNLSFGLQVRDINAKYTWDATKVWNDGLGSKDDLFPLMTRLGVAYDPRADLTLTSDLVVNGSDIGESSDAFDLHFGGEWRKAFDRNKNLAFRAGWNGDSPVFGLGVDLGLRYGIKARMDYSYLIEKVAPTGSHLIGWTFKLD